MNGYHRSSRDCFPHDKLLPALTGLIGSAIGFYFGSKSSNA
jgi:hypothetical protein